MTACPVCSNIELTAFFELSNVPVFCNILCDTPPAARAVARGDIQLTWCPSCDLVFNAAFDESAVSYSPDYENALHYSPRFQAHAEKLARRLISDHQLSGANVLEIGCGDGQFLSQLCHLGVGRGFGCDPGYDARRAADVRHANVTIVRSNNPSELCAPSIELVCCRHVLEHVRNPRSFLRDVQESLTCSSETAYYFEVPSGLHIFRHHGIWDVIYEHVLYFTPPSLANLFRMAGFDSIRVAEAFGGQFLELDARLGDDGDSLDQGVMSDLTQPFQDAYASTIRQWKRDLTAWSSSGQTVALWGAGSKGVMFLNLLDPDCTEIDVVVDVNTRKHGKCVAGTGHRIVSPNEVAECAPNRIIVMNPLYRQEIQEQLAQQGVSATICCMEGV